MTAPRPGAPSARARRVGLAVLVVLTLFVVPIMYRWIAPKELTPETTFTVVHDAPNSLH